MLRHIKLTGLFILSVFCGLSAIIIPPIANADIEVVDTALISATSQGEPSNGMNTEPSMSSDGRFVAFASRATNLLPETELPTEESQVFLYDRQLQTIEIISRSSEGQIGDATSYPFPHSVSADGRYVLFASSATNLTPDYIGSGSSKPFYYYLRDRQLGTTTRIDASANNANGSFASMSNNGSLIAFDSGDRVYLYNVTSRSIIGNLADNSHFPTLSTDGRYVSYALNDDFYRYDSMTESTTEFAAQSNPTGFAVLSPDGQYAAYYEPNGSDANDGSSIYLESVEGGDRQLITNFSLGSRPNSLSISDNNRFISFYTLSREGNPQVRHTKAWVADTTTGQKLLIDDRTNDFTSFTQLALSADGLQLAYHASLPGGEAQVFVAELGQTDTLAPNISETAFSPNPKSVNDTPVELYAQVADDASGVESVEYYDPVQDVWAPMSLNGATATATINTPAAQYPAGNYEFQVRATDEAGNQATESAHLYVYNPASNAFGLGRISPNGLTSNPGDNLPEMPSNAVGQFFFAVTYAGGAATAPTGTSTFTFGSNCLLPWSSCFRITTSSFDWLIVNDNTATFQGTANLTLGNQNLGSDFIVRVTATNGTSGALDHYLLQVYEAGSNPETAVSLYQASGDISTGLIVL